MSKVIESPFGQDDLVIVNRQGHPTAGGFKVNSIIASAGDELKKQSGGGLSAFKDLAVPAGLFLMQRVASNNFTSSSSDQVIDEKLYTKLVDMVDESPKPKRSLSRKRSTRKVKSTGRKRRTTRKK